MNLRMFSRYFKVSVALFVFVIVLKMIFLRKKTSTLETDENFYEEIKNNSNIMYGKIFPDYNFKPHFMRPGYAKDDLYADKIPKIIHQIWDTEMVPNYFSKWMKTWKTVNPTWEHWFWTLEDARVLVEKHYPKYLSLYDSYLSSIYRADAARYFIIHHHGGVYFDLDMTSLRRLDNWTHEYDCIVSEEPYEHSFVVREQNKTNLLNGFIASKEGHPFIELTIRSLVESAGEHFGDYLQATGPTFFTNVYELWSSHTRDKRNKEEKSEVKVLPPKYFFPTYDRSESDTLSFKCHPNNLKKLPTKGQAVCRHLILTSFNNDPDDRAYTNHDWLHSYMFGDGFKTANVVNVTDIVHDIIHASTQI